MSSNAVNRLVTVMFDNGTAHLRNDYSYTVRNQVEQITRYSDLAGTTEVGRTSTGYDDAGRTTPPAPAAKR